MRVTPTLKLASKILLSLQITNLRWKGFKKKKIPLDSLIFPKYHLWSLFDLDSASSHRLFCSHLLSWQLPRSSSKAKHVPSARTKLLP